MLENKNPQEKYEEYRMKFAKTYKHTLESATECQPVKSYKEYLERLHNAKIDESVKEVE